MSYVPQSEWFVSPIYLILSSPHYLQNTVQYIYPSQRAPEAKHYRIIGK